MSGKCRTRLPKARREDLATSSRRCRRRGLDGHLAVATRYGSRNPSFFVLQAPSSEGSVGWSRPQTWGSESYGRKGREPTRLLTDGPGGRARDRSEEHTSELQSRG